MEPVTVRPEAGLVDLLDRVLDRGLVIHADIMITLAGIPLVGLNLRAQLAGIETMLADPRMEEWDARIRARSARDAEARRAHDESRRVAALGPAADHGVTPRFQPSGCEPVEPIVASSAGRDRSRNDPFSGRDAHRRKAGRHPEP